MPRVGENTSVFTGNLARLQCPIITKDPTTPQVCRYTIRFVSGRVVLDGGTGTYPPHYTSASPSLGGSAVRDQSTRESCGITSI